MAVFRFRVCFEEDDEVVRIFEMKSSQNLEDMLFAILRFVEFDSIHNASLFLSDDYWKKGREHIFLPEPGKEDISLFAATRLSTLINDPHQKMVLVYDFEAEWTLQIELIGLSPKEDPKKDYPLLVRAEGKAPKQYRIKRKIGEDLEEDEFDYLTKNLLSGEVAEQMEEQVDEGDTDNLESEEGEDLDNDSDVLGADDPEADNF